MYQAFESACQARNARGMIFHSDLGGQYTSYAFRERLAKRDAIQSMSAQADAMTTPEWRAFLRR